MTRLTTTETKNVVELLTRLNLIQDELRELRDAGHREGGSDVANALDDAVDFIENALDRVDAATRN